MKLAQIADLLSAAAKRSEEYMPSQKQNPVSKASRIIQYVNDNYIFINNINDITERFGVSESYIFKIFKQEFNTTPKKYLYSLKLNNACHWLENRNATIKAIAFDSGFECYEYFIRLFKETAALGAAGRGDRPEGGHGISLQTGGSGSLEGPGRIPGILERQLSQRISGIL